MSSAATAGARRWLSACLSVREKCEELVVFTKELVLFFRVVSFIFFQGRWPPAKGLANLGVKQWGGETPHKLCLPERTAAFSKEWKGGMPSDAKAKRQAAKAAKQVEAAKKGGAVIKDPDAASTASTETAASKGAAAGKQTFFERTGKNAAARKNMNMDISVTDITLYAGDAGSQAHGGEELLDRSTLALTYGRNYGMVGRNGVVRAAFEKGIISKYLMSHTRCHDSESTCRARVRCCVP